MDQQLENLIVGAMFVAHGITRTLETQADWLRFYDQHLSPEAFAERAFPTGRYDPLVREGFIQAFKVELSKARIFQ